MIEAVENGALHEIYSAPDGSWYDNAIPGQAGNATALSLDLRS
ncbi:hypothetical protein [Kitasatospora aureofaciens]|nr:hypothetical protein [Kitasatospora aureofaciens]